MMLRTLARGALRPGVVAGVSVAAAVSGTLYEFARSARFLKVEDAKAYAMSAHPELPSKLATIANEASWREALGHEFSEAATNSLLSMPPVQLLSTLRLVWVLPLIALLVVAAARRTAPESVVLRSVNRLAFALVLLNATVAVNAIWMHGAGAERALLSCLRACIVHIALGTAYVTVFGTLHQLVRRSSLVWLAASLGVWGASWLVRMTLRALESDLQYWLLGSADTRLLGPDLAQVAQGLTTCACWALASAALVYVGRKRAATRSSLSSIPHISRGRS